MIQLRIHIIFKENQLRNNSLNNSNSLNSNNSNNQLFNKLFINLFSILIINISICSSSFKYLKNRLKMIIYLIKKVYRVINRKKQKKLANHKVFIASKIITQIISLSLIINIKNLRCNHFSKSEKEPLRPEQKLIYYFLNKVGKHNFSMILILEIK